MHILVPFILAALIALTGCVSRSPMANSATDVMGDWSPVGSQQVTRQRQFVLSNQYRLYVGRSDDSLSSREHPDLNQTVSVELARYLRRYFVEVDLAQQSQNLTTALKAAAAADADILLLPRIESWPNIDPIGTNHCPETNKADAQAETKTANCPENNESKNAEGKRGEMALSVAIYDVRGRNQIDVVSAQGRRGATAYMMEKKQEDLESLCNAIASQLSSQAKSD